MKLKKLIIIIGILIIAILYPFQSAEPIKYINRESGELRTEKVLGEYWLNWLYSNPLGELSLELIVKRKIVSELYGNRMDSPESANKIDEFVKNYDIDISIAQKQIFDSFNDFFYRKLKEGSRSIDTSKYSITSPADGKILVYNNIDNQDFIVKGYRFNLNEFLQNEELANEFKGGSLMIVRLCPTDYHRYHFPYAGSINGGTDISGDYYSVSPLAIKKNIEIICINKRAYLEVENKDFGKYIIAEVGATMVGSIIRTYNDKNIEKGEEMGYFKFGGSTIILIFPKDKITIDKDLIDNTINGLETEVQMGEKIGRFHI